MPKCRICEQPMPDDARFCGQCGTSVDASIPLTQIVLPSSKKPDKILVLTIGILSVALVLVSFLKTGVIPTSWPTPPTIMVQNPHLPYRLSCSCKLDLAITITKIAVAPEAGFQIWTLSIQNISNIYAKASFLDFSLRNASDPAITPYKAFGNSIAHFDGDCTIQLNSKETWLTLVTFPIVTLDHAQYILTSSFDSCSDGAIPFNSVPFTFS